MTPYYTPDTYKARSSIGYLVRRARNLMMGSLDAAFAAHEINFMHWVILMHLHDNLANTASELAREMCHDSGALTRVIDQLDQRGLIERCRSDADRRVITLTLTEEGRKLVTSLIPLVVDLLNQALKGFTHQEIDTLTNLLMRLTNDLAEFPPGTAPAALECSR